MRRERADILVLGGGPAGVSAAVSAKKRRPKARVVLVSSEPSHYMRPAVTALLEDPSMNPEEIVSLDPVFLLSQGVEPFTRGRVTELSYGSAHARGPWGEVEFEYDSLVIATGGKPLIPPVEGVDLGGVYSIRTLADARKLAGLLKPGVRLAVVGAGLAGVKLAIAASKRGAHVTLLEMKRVLWTVLDPPLTELARKLVEGSGVRVIENKAVDRLLEGPEATVGGVEAGGETFEVDLVVFATGVEPNSALARSLGLKLGIRGAIKTDEEMSTSKGGVWAAGDCAETLDLVTGKPTYRPIGSIAFLGGKIAGINAAGGGARYRGFIRRQAEDVKGIHLVSLGLTGAEAQALGLKYDVVELHSSWPDPQLPWWLKRTLKLAVAVAERGTGRLLGFQAIGGPLARRKSYTIIQMIAEGREASSLETLGFKAA